MSFPTSRRRIALLIMGGVFLVWAYYQFNDPDAAVWMALYGAASVASLLGAFGRLPRALAFVLIAGAVGGAIVQGVHVVAGGEFIFAEHGREMLGALIVAAWTLVALRWSRRRTAIAESSRNASKAT